MSWTIMRKFRGSDGKSTHTVELNEDTNELRCSCPHFRIRHPDFCKHTQEVASEFDIQRKNVIFLVVEKVYEYDDQYYNDTGGYTPKIAFRDKAQAQTECDKLNNTFNAGLGDWEIEAYSGEEFYGETRTSPVIIFEVLTVDLSDG